MLRPHRPRRGPAPHPGPPADLASRKLPFKNVKTNLVRMHVLSRDPGFFGRLATFRFDAPGKEFGVLYAGNDALCAFIETFGNQLEPRLIALADLEKRGLAEVRPIRPLRLIDLAGKGLARLSADARLTNGGDYALSRQWSLALHEHPQVADGIWYRSRHDQTRFCAAIFERAEAAVEVVRLGPLVDPGRLAVVKQMLDTYQFGLV